MQRNKVIFSERQPDYRYMPLGNGMADVFIYKFVEEHHSESEEGEDTSFIYEFNEFRVNEDEITEEMISENPLDYLDYSNEVEDVTLEERVNTIENYLLEQILGGNE